MRVVRIGRRAARVSRRGGSPAVDAATNLHAGRLHAVEDAVELVSTVLVGGPDGLEVVELSEVAEAAVGRLRHGPLSAPVPAEALRGLDPEAFRSLFVEEPRTLACRYRGQKEARGESDGTRGWRDEVRKVAERPQVQMPALGREQFTERRALRHVSRPEHLDAPRGSWIGLDDRAAGPVAGREDTGLLEQLARGGHPEGQGGQATFGGHQALGGGTRDAVTAAQDFRGAVVRVHLAAGKGVEAPEEAHALLAPDHVHLGGSLRARADEEDGGRGFGRDGRGRCHGAGARVRRSSASCSISASADTGLATTRSTN